MSRGHRRRKNNLHQSFVRDGLNGFRDISLNGDKVSGTRLNGLALEVDKG